MTHRHAYLIMAHNEWDVLNTLLAMLDDERNDIYLHIDRKVAAVPALYRPRKAGLELTAERNDVRWGDVSVYQTEMLLYRAAAAHGPYQYYHNISGVDLPIKTQDHIHAFFDRNEGKEFLGFFPLDDFIRADIERKRRRHYLLMRYNFRTPFVPRWKVLAAQVVRHLALRAQDAVHYSRGSELTFRTGHAWASLTQEGVDYLLSREAFIRRRFRHTTCADEMYKHSLFISDPALRARLYDTEDGLRGSMRFVDFQRAGDEQRRRGEPYTWQEGDLEELLSSPYLFARKMSGRHPALLRALAERCGSGGGGPRP